ncbi:MAG: NADH-quinone oxidoreductase subunit L, partial [Wenzhouxiangellaceae bacterium]
GAGFATFAVYAGVVVTALYTFRMLYLTFHGKSRVERETLAHAQESPWVVTLPLILLAIPSLLIGWLTVEPLLFSGALSDAIQVAPERDPLVAIGQHFHGATAFALHGFVTPVFWLAMLGVGIATWIYLFSPSVAATIKSRLHPLWTILDRKYG